MQMPVPPPTQPFWTFMKIHEHERSHVRALRIRWIKDTISMNAKNKKVGQEINIP